MILRHIFMSILLLCLQGEAKKLTLYISADKTSAKASGTSIEYGIHTALSQIDYQIQTCSLSVIFLDHRGSTPRARHHLETILKDSTALTMFSGLHSPPLLATRDYINSQQFPVLDPWAAAAPITRPPKGENWIFRLSIDDSKAGLFIAKHAIQREKYKRPYLILEDTGWGRSNNKSMSAALKLLKTPSMGVSWFNWSLGINQAKQILRKANQSGADVLFFVGNAPEGKIFAQGMYDLPKNERLPIRSHWGITGGDFPKVITAAIRNEIDLQFLQTSFSFLDTTGHPIAHSVFSQFQKLYPSYTKVQSLEAPTGFIHAYDLTRILISALKGVSLDQNIRDIRKDLHYTLEHLTTPITGLVKTYQLPFSPWSPIEKDSHEALYISDFRMAQFGTHNEIILIQ